MDGFLDSTGRPFVEKRIPAFVYEVRVDIPRSKFADEFVSVRRPRLRVIRVFYLNEKNLVSHLQDEIHRLHAVGESVRCGVVKFSNPGSALWRDLNVTFFAGHCFYSAMLRVISRS